MEKQDLIKLRETLLQVINIIDSMLDKPEAEAKSLPKETPWHKP